MLLNTAQTSRRHGNECEQWLMAGVIQTLRRGVNTDHTQDGSPISYPATNVMAHSFDGVQPRQGCNFYCPCPASPKAAPGTCRVEPSQRTNRSSVRSRAEHPRETPVDIDFESVTACGDNRDPSRRATRNADSGQGASGHAVSVKPCFR